MTALSRRDTLLVLLVILIWGGHFAVIKAGVGEVGALISLTLRFAVTFLLFLPFFKWPGWETFKKIAEIGFLMGVIHQGMMFTGMQNLDSSSVAVLVQSQTIFSVILGRIMLGETFAWRTTLGLMIGAIGVVVMLGVPDVGSNPISFFLVVGSASVLALSYIRMRQLPKVNPMTFIAIINGVSLPLAALASFMTDGMSGWSKVPDANWLTLSGVLAYQAVLIAITHILWQRLLSRNEVARVTCYTLLTPVVAIAISVLFLGKVLTWPLLLGAGLIMGGLGIVVIRRVQMKRDRPVNIID
ncbi:MAG: EamA family transporter [Proteobacteria bacterium]|nr:EamA family transporter [Pseudomonadota bacterium]